MSDIDYNALFMNGQLQWKEPTHREILDLMFRAHWGTDTSEFAALLKYAEYLAEVHHVIEGRKQDEPVEETQEVEVPEEPKEEELQADETAEKPKRRVRALAQPIA